MALAGEDLAEFAAASEWMRWQMAQHVSGYNGGFPVWLWVRLRRDDLVCNLRPRRHGLPGRAAPSSLEGCYG